VSGTSNARQCRRVAHVARGALRERRWAVVALRWFGLRLRPAGRIPDSDPFWPRRLSVQAALRARRPGDGPIEIAKLDLARCVIADRPIDEERDTLTPALPPG
jgi:hypothetical protein